MNIQAQALTGLLAAAFLVTAGCDRADPPVEVDEAEPYAEVDAPEPAPREYADMFMSRIAEHCGNAYAGRVVANEPLLDDDPFTGADLVMHVRECRPGELRIPFHVGDDHSRTWILTRTDTGIRLKHDHRHQDGSEDEVTMYGGDTAAPGNATRQEFPVDDYSIELFRRVGFEQSVTNVWAMEIEAAERFVYELARPREGRLLRVEFDLTTPVETPPTPWGHPEIQ